MKKEQKSTKTAKMRLKVWDVGFTSTLLTRPLPYMVLCLWFDGGRITNKKRLVTGRLVILFPVVLTTTCTDLFGEQHGYVPDCSYLFAKQVDPCRWNNLFQLVPWTTVFHYCDIKLFRIVIRTTCFIPVEQLAPTCSRYQVVTSRYIDLLPLVGPTTWYCLPWQVVPICWLIKIATSLSTTCNKVVSPTTC